MSMGELTWTSQATFMFPTYSVSCPFCRCHHFQWNTHDDVRRPALREITVQQCEISQMPQVSNCWMSAIWVTQINFFCNSNVLSIDPTEAIFNIHNEMVQTQSGKAGLTTEWSGMLENLRYVAFSLLLKYFCKSLYLSSPELGWSADEFEVSWNKTTL